MADSVQPDAEHIRVVVIDDHAMFAESIARALDRAPDIHVVATAKNCAEGLAAVTTHRPDVAVVDYRLPDGDGDTLAASIRDVLPDTSVVMLTGLGSERAVVAALDSGCAGFLTKDKAIVELVDAVRSVSAGKPYIPHDVLTALMPRVRTSFRSVGSELTPREREILQLLTDGLSNEAIATHLVLSKHTVRNHVQNVLTKLDAHAKLEAVAIGVREGLVERHA